MRSGDEIREIFNLRYNNLNSGVAPGLNDFEISLLLTDAQKQIIDEYYTGLFAKRQPFESVERLRKNLSVITVENPNVTLEFSEFLFRTYLSYMATLPQDTWRVFYEHAIVLDEVPCLGETAIVVKPVRHDELDKFLKNPFKSPSDYFVLRTDINGKHQLLSKYPLKSYCIRYIKFPDPFIISDLREIDQSDGWAKIEGRWTPKNSIPCIFDNFVEDIIIDRAVELAMVGYKENSLQAQMLVNSRKE